MKTPKLFFLMISILMFGSCSVEKRHYMSGFHITWNKTKSGGNQENSSQNDPLETIINADEPLVVASEAKDDQLFPVQKYSSASALNNTLPKDSCDVIQMKNFDQIMVKVTEINEEVVKYRICSEPNGPEHSIAKDKVNAILYSNGKREPAESFIVKEKVEPGEFVPEDTGEKGDFLARLALSMAICSYIPVVGWTFAIIALIIGTKALRMIDAHPQAYKGRKKAQIALSLAAVAIALGIVVFFIALAIMGFI